jgi:hypothetical protein
MCHRSPHVLATVTLTGLNKVELISQTHTVQKRVKVEVGRKDEEQDILPFLQCLNKDPNLYVNIICHHVCHDPADRSNPDEKFCELCSHQYSDSVEALELDNFLNDSWDLPKWHALLRDQVDVVLIFPTDRHACYCNQYWVNEIAVLIKPGFGEDWMCFNKECYESHVHPRDCFRNRMDAVRNWRCELGIPEDLDIWPVSSAWVRQRG